jgi:hypothetical protein
LLLLLLGILTALLATMHLNTREQGHVTALSMQDNVPAITHLNYYY